LADMQSYLVDQMPCSLVINLTILAKCLSVKRRGTKLIFHDKNKGSFARTI
jgi:hypothetical protein